MCMVKLGIAPIGWTNDDLPELGGEISFEQCISEMALAGFSGCEVGNKFPRDPAVLTNYLSCRNLQIAAAWFSAYLTTKPYEETLQAFIEHRDFLYAMGAKIIVVSEQGKSIQGDVSIGVTKNQPIFSDEQWVLLTNGLEKLGEVAAEKGMKIAYHPHMGTGIQTNADIIRLMDATDPNKVSLLYDCGHLYFAREDILLPLKKYSDRIAHIHLKDVREEVLLQVEQNDLSFLQAVKQGVFTVPGDGAIDFTEVFEVIKQSNYDDWVIVEAEQDPAKANPYVYAKKARQYIQQLAGW